MGVGPLWLARTGLLRVDMLGAGQNDCRNSATGQAGVNCRKA